MKSSNKHILELLLIGAYSTSQEYIAILFLLKRIH